MRAAVRDGKYGGYDYYLLRLAAGSDELFERTFWLINGTISMETLVADGKVIKSFKSHL